MGITITLPKGEKKPLLEGFWGFEILPKSRQRDTQDMCEVFYAVKFQIRVYIFNILFAWSICSDKMIELYTVSYIASMGYFYTCIDLSLEITIEQIGRWRLFFALLLYSRGRFQC